MTKKNIKRILVLIVLLIFSMVWFVPIHIGWYKEMPYCMFRLEVFEYNQHGYGKTKWKDIFIRMKPTKYGSFVFYEKIGGTKAYFGLEPLPYKLTKECCGWEKTNTE